MNSEVERESTSQRLATTCGTPLLNRVLTRLSPSVTLPFDPSSEAHAARTTSCNCETREGSNALASRSPSESTSPERLGEKRAWPEKWKTLLAGSRVRTALSVASLPVSRRTSWNLLAMRSASVSASASGGSESSGEAGEVRTGTKRGGRVDEMGKEGRLFCS